ncbi:MAG TPA: diacylglycerol kinase family protein [Nitrospiraceae bacterium]|nr:diacylglycerol kinase family protein [Nitrospiraceae bacterium]
MVCCTLIAALFGLVLRPWLPARRSPLVWRLTTADAPVLPSYRRARLQSFRHAFAGLTFVVCNESNMRIHLAAAVVAAILGWLLHIDAAEWRWLILAVGIVLGAEVMNTAVEQACNAITRQHNAAIKIARDAAAGAVLLSAVIASLIGASVFAPYLTSHH